MCLLDHVGYLLVGQILLREDTREERNIVRNLVDSNYCTLVGEG